MKKVSRGFSAVEVMVVIVVLALIGVIGYLVYQAQTAPTATQTNSTPSAQTTPQTVAVDEQTYTLTLPAGWKKATAAPNDYVDQLASGVEASGYYRYYQDENGNYFAVSVDPTGRGFEANETWQLNATESGYKVGSKTTCKVGEELCTPQNATEYRVGLKSNGAKLGEHSYFFFAGNTTKTTGVEVSTFQTIVESFAVK